MSEYFGVKTMNRPMQTDTNQQDSYALSRQADQYLKENGCTIWGREMNGVDGEQRKFEKAKLLYNNNGPKK